MKKSGALLRLMTDEEIEVARCSDDGQCDMWAEYPIQCSKHLAMHEAATTKEDQ